MKVDVARYVKYYNVERLRSANGDQSPMAFEKQREASKKSARVLLDQGMSGVVFIRPISSER
ncbi:hypothetical protein [Agaribacterium haliotis]|uniref:hypothetical protein n=1 Tax=Agaribacterium haliotis TaxID=2013869 RepID=UPI0039C87E93